MTHLDSTLISWLVTILDITVSLIASAHVVLTKRNTRSAIGWIGLIWLSPIVGTILYVLFGINRIERRARLLRKGQVRSPVPPMEECPPERLGQTLGPSGEHLVGLARLVGAATGRPVLAGNLLEPLRDGDAAYPAMLAAIDAAGRSIALSSYIFNDDRAGQMFVEALARAVQRGLAVRVLVDGLGSRYHWPSIFGALRRAGVPSGAFLRSMAPGWLPYLNLRNHRKLLIVDGRHGFTGGLNIDEDYLASVRPRRPKHDLHFRLEGPIIATLMKVFADDWVFATGELLRGDDWFPTPAEAGAVLARGIADGPDEDMDKLELTLIGAVTAARSSVTVVTPYFLPDAALAAALGVAALRGVDVDIILPGQNNLMLVQWASTAGLGLILERGCRVWLSPPPFDHTKLMIVDRTWALIGSGNWDARSLRLNFEFNVECYSAELATMLDLHVRSRIAHARPYRLDDLRRRPLAIKLRDGVARLLSPYL